MLNDIFNSEQFKCTRCKNSLSIAPILVVENDDLYCGRCRDAIYEKNSNPKIERQILYEKIAKNLKFSCCYESVGCESILEWEQVEEHEKTCGFRQMECLFNLNKSSDMNACNWKGDRQDYFQHIQEKHSKNVNALDKLEIWNNPKTEVLRIDFLRQIMLVVLIFIDNIYYFTLIGSDKDTPVEYTIEIQDETKRKSLISTQFSTFLPRNFEDLKKYGINLKGSNFDHKYLSVYFGDKCPCIRECNAILLPLCDVCKKGIIDPVFTCELNHKNCDKCTKTLNKPQGKCRFSEECANVCNKNLTENKYLWKQYQRQHYRCRNAGCFYHGNFLEIKSHISFCRMKRFEFPEILKLDTYYSVESSVELKRTFKFDNQPFLLMINKPANCLECRLIAWTPPRVEYKFEVSFSSSSNTVLSFPIHPIYFDVISLKPINTENSIIIPIALINQDGTGALAYKLNIWKS